MPHPAVVLFTAALVATLFAAPGRKTRAIFLASLLGLVIALVAESPLRTVGDAPEYLVMAKNLGQLSRPSLTAEQLENAKTLVGEEAGLRLEKPWLRAADGRQDSPHFWFYSLAAAPFVRGAQALGANPLAGFTVLNIALLMGTAMLLAARASPAVAVLVAAGPVLWWVDKAHTEVFTSALLAASLVLLRQQPWWSILALGAASTQNPPIAGAMLVAIAFAYYERGGRDRRVWAASLVAIVLASLHPLYFRARLGVWSGMYDAIDRHWPSSREFLAVAFDPNLGIFVHAPLLLLALAIAIVEALTRPSRRPLGADAWTFALMALIFLVSFTQTTNVNSGGTPGPSRYGLWLVPFAVPLLSSVRADARWLRVLAGGSVAWCAWAFAPALPDQYLRPSTLASDVWRRWPGLDNPLAEVFAERVAGREPSRPPVATDGCEKLLLIGDGTGAAWPSHCTAVALPDFCQAKDALCYGNKVDGGYRFVRAQATSTWLAEATREAAPRVAEGMFVITQNTGPPVPMAIWHDEGWSYPERLTEFSPDIVSRQWRWFERHATLGVMASQPMDARMTIFARSLNRPRRMRISVGADEVVTIVVGDSIAEYQTPRFELAEGTSTIALESLDAAESPSADDPRQLSVAVFRIELVATKQ